MCMLLYGSYNIIMVITTNGTFNICGITSHKTSAFITRIIIRRKEQTNGRHILNDEKIGWQNANGVVLCTFRWMGEKILENTIRNLGRSGDLHLCLQYDWQVITSLHTVVCVLTTNKLIVELKENSKNSTTRVANKNYNSKSIMFPCLFTYWLTICHRHVPLNKITELGSFSVNINTFLRGFNE